MTRIASAQKSLYCRLEREKRTEYKIKDSLDYGFVALMSTNKKECKISRTNEKNDSSDSQMESELTNFYFC